MPRIEHRRKNNEEKTGFVLRELSVKLKKDMTCDIYGNPVRGRVFPTFDYADFILTEAKVLANVILP